MIRVVRDGIVIFEDKKLPQDMSAVLDLSALMISRLEIFLRRISWKRSQDKEKSACAMHKLIF